MNIITVIPLTRSKVAAELSYFTAADVPVGAIVEVPLRSKTIRAIVTGSRAAEDLKAEIRQAPYQIRKLESVKASVFFPAAFVEACKILADYYATNIGAIIDSLVGDILMENVETIAPALPAQASLDMGGAHTPKNGTKISTDIPLVYAIQGDDSDRISSWRSLIRQEFARKRSIAVYVPTIEDCNIMYEALEKGIEGYIFQLNSSLPKKTILETWAKLASIEHPIVVIATGTFSLLPRGDIETIVIERENGRGWISQKMPYLDLRHALEIIAKQKAQKVFIADSILRAETLHRIDSEEIERGSPFKWRSISSALDILVDMKTGASPAKSASSGRSGENGEIKTEKKFRTLSPQLNKLIQTNHDESTHMFILTARRGMASITVCDDCETVVRCNRCQAVVVLHTGKANGNNYFMCHRCGERRVTDETCTNCGSWRLTPLGVGIERVEAEIRESFPGVDLFKIDADATKGEKQISEVLERFYSKPGSILLGTELALLHLTRKVEHVGIASLDSLFSLPDFRSSERLMYILTRLRHQAIRTILLQTRMADERIFEYGLKGNLSDFYRSLLVERKQFNYPPFSVLLKITVEGKKDVIAETMSSAQKLLMPRELEIFPAFTATTKGASAIHGLLFVESHAWPDADLVAKLRSLPPGVMVKVNPESLL